jgi:hypothetical protein
MKNEKTELASISKCRCSWLPSLTYDIPHYYVIITVIIIILAVLGF